MAERTDTANVLDCRIGTMDITSFYHVAIKVTDLTAAEAFYCDQLGAEVIRRSDAAESTTGINHVALSLADMQVYLFDRAPYEAAGIVDTVSPGVIHFGYVVEDIDAAHQELADDGVEFLMEPDVYGELKIAFFTDPDGNRVELLEHRQ